MIHLKIRPVPKGRPRFSARGKFVRVHTPKKTKDFEDKIREKVSKILEPRKGFVGMEIEFALQPANSFSQKKKEALYGRPYDLKNIDLDNLLKAFLDGLNGVAFDDDSQVVEIKAKKFYAEEDCIDFRIYDIK